MKGIEKERRTWKFLPANKLPLANLSLTEANWEHNRPSDGKISIIKGAG